jgi:transcriptional regulator GlxA family with amidase domain
MSILDTHLPLDENKINYICAQAILAPICYEITQKCEFTLRSRPLEDVMSSVLAYMNSHFTEDLTLESVAHATALHPVTLSKMFSKRAGINFNFYLQYLRSSYAASLIKAEDLTFTEIAYMAGFGCIRSFNRAFVNIYGITPTEYRLSSSV